MRIRNLAHLLIGQRQLNLLSAPPCSIQVALLTFRFQIQTYSPPVSLALVHCHLALPRICAYISCTPVPCRVFTLFIGGDDAPV
jgi:hypothetical protein